MKLFSANAIGKRINATTSSGASFTTADSNGSSVRIVNHGPDTAYLSISPKQQAATVPSANAARTCTTVLAGSDITLGLNGMSGEGPLQIAALTASGSATLDVFVSDGM